MSQTGRQIHYAKLAFGTAVSMRFTAKFAATSSTWHHFRPPVHAWFELRSALDMMGHHQGIESVCVFIW